MIPEESAFAASPAVTERKAVAVGTPSVLGSVARGVERVFPNLRSPNGLSRLVAAICCR
jgi:hypothetical protein